MWIYEQKTGNLYHNEEYIWTGYSGHGAGWNNPDMEMIPNIGPIPKGEYAIGMPLNTHLKLGPYVMELTPKPGTNTYGRSGFFLHGDDAEHDASHGCIIKSPKSARMLVGESSDRDLRVV